MFFIKRILLRLFDVSNVEKITGKPQIESIFHHKKNPRSEIKFTTRIFFDKSRKFRAAKQSKI